MFISTLVTKHMIIIEGGLFCSTPYQVTPGLFTLRFTPPDFNPRLFTPGLFTLGFVTPHIVNNQNIIHRRKFIATLTCSKTSFKNKLKQFSLRAGTLTSWLTSWLEFGPRIFGFLGVELPVGGVRGEAPCKNGEFREAEPP